MKLFALETDDAKLRRSFLTSGEYEVMAIAFHGFVFFVTFIRQMLLTLILAAVAAGLWYAEIPLAFIIPFALVVWIAFIFPRLLRAYIDWKYDVLIVTNEKIVIVDQSSVFRRDIRQMNLENLASVGVETQFWNIFPFGAVHFDLKEGTGQRIILHYIPSAREVALRISEVLTAYQRRGRPVGPQLDEVVE